MGVAASKFYAWRGGYGRADEHNALIPRDWWLEDWDKQAILAFHAQYPVEAYLRPALMMLD